MSDCDEVLAGGFGASSEAVSDSRALHFDSATGLLAVPVIDYGTNWWADDAGSAGDAAGLKPPFDDNFESSGVAALKDYFPAYSSNHASAAAPCTLLGRSITRDMPPKRAAANSGDRRRFGAA